MYVVPLYVPSCPISAFLHRTGLTAGSPEFEPSDAGGSVTDGVVGAGDVGEPGVAESVAPDPGGAFRPLPQAGTVVEAHSPLARFVMRPCSLWSMVRPHRDLMATQSAM